MKGDGLDGTVREGNCLLKFVDQLVKELETGFNGLAMSILLQIGSSCSQEVSQLLNVSSKNFREWEGR